MRPRPDRRPTGGRAIVYLRVSTPSQVKTDYDPEGYSIPAQRKACQQAAERRGFTIVDEYVEPGRSATEMTKRVELRRMINRIRRDRDTDVVIVHKLSRLFRNRWEEAIVCTELKEYGVTLVSATEAIDDSPEGQFLQAILSANNEFRSRQDGEDIAYKMGEKAKRGGTLGLAPLGYRNTIDHVEDRRVRTVEHDPDRAPHITWMFDQYATGEWSLHRLAEAASARGLTLRPTARRPARPLDHKAVAHVLTNRYYLGEVRYKGMYYPGRHRPLTDQATFAKVQEVMASHRNGGVRAQKHWHYLAGSLRCARCGSGLVYNVITGRGGRYDYFTCIGRLSYHNGCDLPYLPAEEVEQAVEHRWAAERLPDTLWDDVRTRLHVQLDQIRQARRAEREVLTRRISAVNDERTKWAEATFTGTVPSDIAQTKQAELAGQLAALEDELADNSDLTSEGTEIDQAIDILATATDRYTAASPDHRRTMNQLWFGKFDIDDEHGEPAVTDSERTTAAQAVRDLCNTDRPEDGGSQDANGAPDLTSPSVVPTTINPGQTHKRRPGSRRGVSHASVSNMNALVGLTGFEPATFRSQSGRATNLRHSPCTCPAADPVPLTGPPEQGGPRGRSSMVEPQSSKLATRVRFPSSARCETAGQRLYPTGKTPN